VNETAVSFPSTDGLTLEGAIAEPSEVRGGIVLCHPHPRQGGTMNAPLLVDLRDRLVEAGWAVLRFNFRGIGSSEGTSSDGIAETADAAGAMTELTQRLPSASIAIIGWSFGAGVAVRCSIEGRPAACVAIAPPLVAKPGTSAGLVEPARWPRDLPLLVVCGGRDHLVASDECRRWAELAGARFHEIPAANHFFWARYDALGHAIVDFLSSF
jgi:uncharacterized protein